MPLYINGVEYGGAALNGYEINMAINGKALFNDPKPAPKPTPQPQKQNISLDITFKYESYAMGNTISPIKDIPYKDKYSMTDLKQYGYDYVNEKTTHWNNHAIKNLVKPDREYPLKQVSANHYTMDYYIN